MKKLVTLMSLLFMSCFIIAQDIPPQAVKDAFAKKFVDAQTIEWGQEDAGIWEAEFTLSGIEKSACFTDKGEWVETETGITKKELPAEIFKTLALIFDGFEVEEIGSIEKPGFTGFEVELEKGQTTVEILALADGSFTLSSIEVGACCNMQSCEGMGMMGCQGMMNMGGMGGQMDCCKGMMNMESCKGMTNMDCCKGMKDMDSCKGMTNMDCCKGMTNMESCKGMTNMDCCKGMTNMEGCKGMTAPSCHGDMTKGEEEK